MKNMVLDLILPFLQLLNLNQFFFIPMKQPTTLFCLIIKRQYPQILLKDLLTKNFSLVIIIHKYQAKTILISFLHL
jgi:hypothetical protein